MAKRNYTAEAYEQIRKTIEEIDNTDVRGVKDFLWDLVLRIGRFLELYSVEQYEQDMQSWYDIVLDSHDTTLAKVNDIFNAVGEVDSEYQNHMTDAVSSVANFRNTLNCLRDVISGKISLADGKATANGYLTAGKNSLNTAYDTILTKMENQVVAEAGMAVIGDVLKLGAAFCSLLIPAGPVTYAAKGKKFVDSFVAFLGDSGAFASGVLVESIFGCGSLFGMDRKNYLDFRASQLMQNQKFVDMNSVSIWLGGIAEDMEETLEDCPPDSPYYSVVKTTARITAGVDKASEVVDMTADTVGIVNDLKDMHELFNGKWYSKEEFLKVIENKGRILEIKEGKGGTMYRVGNTASEIVRKVVSNWTSIPTSGWSDPTKSTGNVFKTLGTIWSYGEKLAPDPANGQIEISELIDVAFDKNKNTKFLKDIFDFARHYLVKEVG